MSMTFEQRLADCEAFLIQQAKEWQRRNPTLCLDDLLQEGRLAVLEMHARYNPELGLKFLTFAGMPIRQRMRAHAVRFRDPVRGPERQMGSLDIIEIDAPLSDEGGTLAEILAAPTPSSLWFEDREIAALLRQTMAGLSQRERTTLDARFFRGLTLDQTAGELNTSRTNVHHWQTRAMAKLRQALAPHL